MSTSDPLYEPVGTCHCPAKSELLPGVDRFIDLSTTIVCRTRPAVVYTVDRSCCPACKNDVVEALNPVPVFGDSDSLQRIGFATVSMDGDRVMAEFFIVRDCPERLDIELGRATSSIQFQDNLYACPNRLTISYFVIMVGDGLHNPLEVLP